MAKKTKPSTKPKSNLEKQYDRLTNNIKRRIRKAEIRGFQFDHNVLPKKPKKVTEGSIRKLSKLKGEGLYKKARYGGPLSGGEIIPGAKGRKLERSEASRKSAETRKRRKEEQEERERVNRDRDFWASSIIENFKENLTTFNDRIQSIMNNWIDGLISEHGKQAVAEMLEEGAQAGKIFTPEIAYTEEKRNQYMAEMVSYLPGGEDRELRQGLSDALEEDEDGFLIAGDYSGLFL